MTMTLECDTEFPPILKDLMLIMGFEGPAVYWGFPYTDEEDNLEYWWVQIYLYLAKEYDHKTGRRCMFTNTVVHPSFFDSARSDAWSAIEELTERLKWRLCNTQKDLKEANEEIEAPQEEIDKTKTLKTTVQD